MKQAKPLHGFHQRKARNVQRPYVTPNTRIPTSDELPEAPADLAAQLDVWHQLAQSEREQARKAAAANAAAEQASLDYRRAVREALAAGKDPAKVKDETEKHRAIAKAHHQFYNDARAQREKMGHALGPVLEEIAPSLFAPVEERIEKSARALRASVAAMRESWAEYSNNFEARRWLSHLAFDGGMAVTFHGAQPVPAKVADALAVLDDHLASVEKLRHDEAEVQAHRDRAAAAEKAKPTTHDVYDAKAGAFRRVPA